MFTDGAIFFSSLFEPLFKQSPFELFSIFEKLLICHHSRPDLKVL